MYYGNNKVFLEIRYKRDLLYFDESAKLIKKGFFRILSLTVYEIEMRTFVG